MMSAVIGKQETEMSSEKHRYLHDETKQISNDQVLAVEAEEARSALTVGNSTTERYTN